jgi:alginate O-acetyltransferase complex protein AlgI
VVFTSHLFLFAFLPFALALYFAAPRRWRNGVLAALSYLFYGWSHPAFVAVMLASTLVDYGCGRWLGEARRPGRRLVLLASLVCNLGALAFFKYANFGIENARALLEALGVGASGWGSTLRITLPLGISFYTFQSMSYTIDLYRGHTRPVRSFVDFACYVSMFPQLVAGPIVRFREIDAQLIARTYSAQRFASGTAAFQLGFAKKVLIANPCGELADLAFTAAAPGCAAAWVGLAAYTLQIYFDFSGYSDMAVGLGRMLGFELPRNFVHPYRARSITDFWRRWHRSLSSWLRDYLYISLGGNRRGRARTYVNLLLVMLLGGLWHGASWNFVIWGGLHGLLLAGERAASGRLPRVPEPLAQAATLLAVMVGWVFFRAEDLGHSSRYLAALFGLAEPTGSSALLDAVVLRPASALVLAVGAALVLRAPDTSELLERPTCARGLLVLALFAAALLLLTSQAHNPFLYFIF